jgi:NAD+ kinase
VAQTLRQRSIDVWQYNEWEMSDVRDQVPGSDLVVAIGGDGAILHAARVCAPFGVPVLGLNMGRLGFLTEIASPDDWDQYLDLLLAGKFWIEDRMMISARFHHSSLQDAGIALNDVVFSGPNAGAMIQLDAYIDGNWATTYNCDALIISTPTGSTAYALAAGGPILPPDLHNILVLPTASHLSMDRAIVLSQGSRVAIRPSIDNRTEVLVTVDGMRLGAMQPEETLLVTVADCSSRFIRMRERNYFYRSLLDRLEPRINRTAPEHMKSLRDILGEDL